jgi:hypothetical protein
VSDFKGRHFEGEIVLWAVRWYCRYGMSYRDLEQMMDERGVSVDHSADSNGPRNRVSVHLRQPLVKCFCRRFPAQRLSRP